MRAFSLCTQSGISGIPWFPRWGPTSRWATNSASAERHAELVPHRDVGPQRGNQGIPEIPDCVQREKARIVFFQNGQVAEKVGELPDDQIKKIEHVAKTEEIRENRVHPRLHAD